MVAAHRRLDEACTVAVAAACEREETVARMQPERCRSIRLGVAPACRGMPRDRVSHELSKLVVRNHSFSTMSM
ncbi:MAG TPA: hypothetical protein VGJ29_16720 [Vicinamibacterales bacterium]|jgi:hypothetical protein